MFGKSKRKKIIISPNKRELSKREKREAERLRKMPDNSVALLIIFILGILSMMYAFVESEMLGLATFIAMGAIFTIVTASMWFVYFYRYRWFIVLTAVIWFITAVAVAWQIPQLMHTYQGFFSENGNVEIGPAVLFILMIAAVYILFSIEFVLRRHSFIFLIGAGIVILGPVGGMNISIVTSILIFVFLVGFVVLNMTDRRPRKSFTIKGRAKIATRTTVLVAIALIAAFIPSAIIQSVNAERMYADVMQADNEIQNGIDTLTGNYLNNVLSGMVSRGNLRQTGQKMFDIQADTIPQENLYLKGYIGGTYHDDVNFWDGAMTVDWPPDYDLVQDPEPITVIHYDEFYDRYIVSDKGEKIVSYEHPDETIKEEHGYDIYIDNDGEFYIVDEDGDYSYLPDEIYTYSPYKKIDLDPRRDQKTTEGNFQYHEMFIESLTRQAVQDYQSTVRDFLKSCLMQDDDMTWAVNQDSYGDISMFVNDDEDSGDNPFTYYGPIHATPDMGIIHFSLRNAEPLLLSLTDNIEAYHKNSKGETEASMDFDPEKQPEVYKLMNYPSILLNTSSADPVTDIYSQLGVLPEAKLDSSYDAFNNIRIYPSNYDSIQNLIPYNAMYTTTNVPTSDTDPVYSSQNDSYYYSNTYYYPGVINMHDQWKYYPVYEGFADSYQEAIQYEYTIYSKGTMPRLEELCNSTRYLQDVNEVTTFIACTLQNNATYTITPGAVPWTKNTVEYFLFENHKGYCVHFATTAAMMYRMFGIPARYVTGYAVSPSLFERVEGKDDSDNMKYSAEVSDYSAHAWVEIFLKDYGWVPVEFTPDMFNMMHTSYPGYDEQEMMRIMDKYGWTFRNIQPGTGQTQGGGAGVFGGFGKTIAKNINKILIITPASIVLLVVIILAVRRKLLLRRLQNMGCRRLFDLMIHALHYCGYIKGLYGCEEDFPQKLAELSCISAKDAQRITQIMLAEVFSETPASGEENKYLLEQYRKICGELYKKLEWYKKPVFKFLLGYV